MSSSISLTRSRSLQVYMRRVSHPISCPAIPSQRRWLCIRSSSPMNVRMYRAWSGTWSPRISSTAWQDRGCMAVGADPAHPLDQVKVLDIGSCFRCFLYPTVVERKDDIGIDHLLPVNGYVKPHRFLESGVLRTDWNENVFLHTTTFSHTLFHCIVFPERVYSFRPVVREKNSLWIRDMFDPYPEHVLDLPFIR